MPLKKMTIENYRGIGRKQTLEFARPDAKTPGSGLTVLVGPNNSGKSTILRVIDAIYSDETNFIAELEDRRGNDFPNISLSFNSSNNDQEINTVTVGQSAYLKKKGNIAEAKDRCRYVRARRPWRDRFARQGAGSEQYETNMKANLRNDSYWVDMFLGNEIMSIDQDEKKKEGFLELLKYIEPTIIEFSVDRAFDQDYITFKSATGFTHRAGIVGEGVLNIFRLCYSLMSQKDDQVLLIDEPELSLHPQSQRRLYQLLTERAKDRQVIVSTHSVHFVDWNHIKSGTKVYRVNISAEGARFCTLSAKTLNSVVGIAANDVLNRKLYDVLAKEIFFSRGCVLVEGQEDAHLLQDYIDNFSNFSIEIFGYGSGGADGIVSWLGACRDLGVRAVGIFDRDDKGCAALSRAEKIFQGTSDLKMCLLPTPDIRDKYKRDANGKETSALDKEGIFSRDMKIKTEHVAYLSHLLKEVSAFLETNRKPPNFQS